MGYTENCLPKFLAKLGHEVHLVTSNLNVYGLDSDYSKNYSKYLGSQDQGCFSYSADGFVVHRLQSLNFLGYVYLRGLSEKIKEIQPDIVHTTAIASIQTILLAFSSIFSSFKLFSECHQHVSIAKDYMLAPYKNIAAFLIYRLTKTLPLACASHFVEKCYAISEDCLWVAKHLYGVPVSKLALQPLGTDCELFCPIGTEEKLLQRDSIRQELLLNSEDILCIYTGRLTKAKNPLILASAINKLSTSDIHFKAIFIGDGPQKDDINNCKNCIVLPFMLHRSLASYYAASDIGIWPKQESMSMLDAAASGLPIIASNKIGDRSRISDNGFYFDEDSVDDLVLTIKKLEDINVRKKAGQSSRMHTLNLFNWEIVAKRYDDDYRHALLNCSS
jgi:glycosyltransferase involved in cell wall biosynthesis